MYKAVHDLQSWWDLKPSTTYKVVHDWKLYTIYKAVIKAVHGLQSCEKKAVHDLRSCDKGEADHDFQSWLDSNTSTMYKFVHNLNLSTIYKAARKKPTTIYKAAGNAKPTTIYVHKTDGQKADRDSQSRPKCKANHNLQSCGKKAHHDSQSWPELLIII